ncbi:MAG: hypothetical protein PVG53_11635 [Holophagae bacterium]|jgi:hypothetical protein
MNPMRRAAWLVIVLCTATVAGAHMSLAPWSNKQINRILEDFPSVNGYIDVSSSTANAAFTCYGSVLDNTTSDPTTIPPQ